jgi:hypothetical protein
MEYALPTAWGSQDSRGFWTKRKKTAMSMLAVLALLAGIALAFKLFEQQVPNNVVRDASNFDFVIEVLRSPVGGGTASWLQAGPPPLEPIFNATDPVTGDPVSQFPGDTREQPVRIRNTNNPSRAATFFMYVDQTSIVVRDCTIDPLNPNVCSASAVVPSSDPNWTKFVNFWTLSVDKEKVLQHEDAFVTEGQLNENDHGVFSGNPGSADHDDSTSFGLGDEEACSGRLRELTKNSPCNLGTILGAGSEDDFGQPTDTRWYTFKMSEAEDGTDQSAFKGWTVTFTMIFQARVPALEESCVVACER